VVVYKIDRLSRSLADSAKLLEVFDRQGVTFVTVTQAFNTTTSMGPLTLNILLSFAQFEREVTAERIRDKFAAPRRKGIWMGGNPPLGYRVENRKLVIVPEDADLVRRVFDRFIETGSSTLIANEQAVHGVRTPKGNRIDKKFVYRILNNRAYICEAVRDSRRHHPRDGDAASPVPHREARRAEGDSVARGVRATASDGQHAGQGASARIPLEALAAVRRVRDHRRTGRA
jgi:DNA invertase Pin-like site-specific DNA recombinase